MRDTPFRSLVTSELASASTEVLFCVFARNRFIKCHETHNTPQANESELLARR